MSMEITAFEFEGSKVRVLKDEKGEPWFVAKDVCQILLLHSGRAYSRLNADEKGKRSTHTPGGDQSMLYVNEPGLYSLVMRSRKPEARRFQWWVTHEVLPRIRKTGAYFMGEEKAAPEVQEWLNKSKADLFKELYEQQLTIEQQEAKLEEQKPKVEAYQGLMNSYGLFNFRNTARILEIPEKVFMNRLRDDEYITDGNMPYAQYRKAGLFMVKAYVNQFNRHGGAYTLITPKGLEFFRLRYGKGSAA